MHTMHALSHRADELRLESSLLVLAVVGAVTARLVRGAVTLERAFRALSRSSRDPARVPFWLRPATAALWGTSALVLHTLGVEAAMLRSVAVHLDVRLRLAVHARAHGRP